MKKGKMIEQKWWWVYRIIMIYIICVYVYIKRYQKHKSN